MINLSVVVPTYNEAENISSLIEGLQEVLCSLRYEIIIVDDNSPDGTANIVQELASKFKGITCIKRIDKRGLSSAVIEGIGKARGEYIVVMDADLQHDHRIIPQMLRRCQKEELDLVVGSRYIEGGELGQFGRVRSFISGFATTVANSVVGLKLKDPLSGFFLLRKSYIVPNVDKLSGKGFKILLDIILSSTKPPKVVEIPFVFGVRTGGKSKLSPLVAMEFFILLFEKRFKIRLPLDLVSYMLVGLSGVIVHLVLLSILISIVHLAFPTAQFFAALGAIASNFFLNNKFTFFQTARYGRRMFRALLHFYVLCLVGLMINLMISSNLYAAGFPWPLAGFIGTIISAFWNYLSAKLIVWR